ncbi:hypothetical protein QFZ24_003401 [Streptomyces phaeochromogenes]|jgi:hypothetical protein|uniref:hypothetical protein n=1 Tax=Streptomyces TaxID=1883 RepID=UPI00117C3520|nr:MULTISPECIES: hypothetical protein [Streptomyces]MDQ0949478.1 hypothetical protein [Streptomyces phaeochromogenes]TRO61176.1 hypothetical protein E4K73_26645 [Streptomyces sp. IB201691-2A2]
MGTKTEDEAGAKTGTEAQRDEEAVKLSKSDETAAIGEVEEAEAAEAADDRADSEVLGEDEDDEALVAAERGSGVGLGAAAVVSAGLGVVSLTGSWVGTIAQARDSLYGQLETAQGAGVAEQIKQVYADSWNANALVAGFFALTALIVGVVVLARPAFGNPDRIPAQAPWVKSVAWAGVALGVVGLLLAALKYSDILLGMPSTS